MKESVSIKLKGRVIVKKNSQMALKTKQGKTFIKQSNRSAQWQKENIAMMTFQFANKETLQPPYRVEYHFQMKGKLDSDIDNMMASINDALQKSNIIGDDKKIIEVHSTKRGGFKDFETEVIIHSNWELEQ